MMQAIFSDLKIGLIVKDKTSKSWMITEFITSFSSTKKNSADEFKLRISNGLGKHKVLSVDYLKKNYKW
jgi:hypothetical protein